MGNTLCQCFHASKDNGLIIGPHGRIKPLPTVRLVFSDGSSRDLLGSTQPASSILIEFPACNIYHAESFFIGRPIRALTLNDDLVGGQTYFVLPVDLFGCDVLSVVSLASLSPTPRKQLWSSSDRPFEYVVGADGNRMIKVLPEFIVGILKKGAETEKERLCNSPELRKQYEMLVGSKATGKQIWSPRLETITETGHRKIS